MFERYITDVLTNNFGHILENVDSDNMRLSAWNGELILEDVALKTTALDTILKGPENCPVEIAYGHIGAFRVKIPWSLVSGLITGSTTSETPQDTQANVISVVLTDVDILITPRRKEEDHVGTSPQPSLPESPNGSTSNNSLIENRAKKERRVQSLLDANLLKRVTESSMGNAASTSKDENPRDKGSWATWVREKLAQLLSTLSITIKNIHIRYEDPGTSMGFEWKILQHSNETVDNLGHRPQRFRPAFSVGITLNEFSVQSRAAPKTKSDPSDQATGPVDLDDTTTSVLSASTNVGNLSIVQEEDFTIRKQHKRAAAKDLSIYWDSTAALMCGRANRKFWEETEDIQKDLFEFYKSCFRLLNEGPSPSRQALSRILPNKVRSIHSYLLDPVSPSVDLLLVSKLPSASTTTTDGSDCGNDEEVKACDTTNERGTSQQPSFSIPPSSVSIELPPCTFTLSRNTLEDAVYLRKSLSVWTDKRKAVVSESALRRILQLRPSESAKNDPVGWWKYAFEATKVMVHAYDKSVEVEEGFEQENYGSTFRKPLTRRKGWIGLVQAVSRRRKYVQLYKVLFEPLASKDDSEKQEARHKQVHETLMEMEDGLLAGEVAAFRIHAYESMKGEDGFNPKDGQETVATTRLSSDDATRDERSLSQSSGSWTAWIRGRDTTSENAGVTSAGDEENNLDTQAIKLAVTKGQTDEEILSMEHRRWMMIEMKQALDREKENMHDQSRRDSVEMKNVLLTGEMPQPSSNPLVWKASLVCRKFALQINDQQIGPGTFRHYRTAAPVIRMSTAWVQDQSWYHDGSWDVEISLAAMEVKDLISATGKRSNSRYGSTLLGACSTSRKNAVERDHEFLVLDGIRYTRNMSVTINRKLHWNLPNKWLDQKQDTDRGSTTIVQIRVLPMEVVYSALPMEAAKRVFSAVKTPELVDDYHRALGVAKSWRNKQKEKLLDTLAHKNKRIVVDIDITAPKLLIPENIYRTDSPMLAINFGRFQAYNDDESHESTLPADYDDQWRVMVSNIQVQSTSIASYHTSAISESSHEQLVEPFSIDFSVSTKFVQKEEQGEDRESHVCVSATLPRLAFNITSSAIRLISRLRQNLSNEGKELKNERTYYDFYDGLDQFDNLESGRKVESFEPELLSSKQSATKKNHSSREFKFHFSAPAITLKLENDVDNTKTVTNTGRNSTPIIDLALRSIRGSLCQKSTCHGEIATNFEASLLSLGVVDLFQGAGEEFALLMSSVPQSKLSGRITGDNGYSWDTIYSKNTESPAHGKDLVSVEYSSKILPSLDSCDEERSDSEPDKISIWFHELYIEWNPETLAAIHNAVRTPSPEDYDFELSNPLLDQPRVLEEDESSGEDEFFDALEEEFFDASDSDSARALSEISTSTDSLAALGSSSGVMPFLYFGIGSPMAASSFSPTKTLSPTFGGGMLGQGRLSFSPRSRQSLPADRPHLGRRNESVYFDALAVQKSKRDTTKSIRKREIVFNLSKLRVSFNKETRHRKLIVAQMDRTFISYATRVTGGSKIKMNLGNLVFIDPTHEDNKTLYGQILGLQTKAGGTTENSFSSLLEMEVIMNPDVRKFSSNLDIEISDTVTIDKEAGRMAGGKNIINARLSPMRFVLIEQLWMEFVDYFFQGIIGTEVLGGRAKPEAENPLASVLLQPMDDTGVFGADAEGIGFTRFDIKMDSPVILLPVTYFSPQYLRMQLSSIHLSNEYDGEIIERNLNENEMPEIRMQWFNNCKISLDGLRLYSWSRRELGYEKSNLSVILRWPVGLLAPMIIPKWNVNCSFDSLDISLCRSDYSLLQNIISYNIGEPSRYMDEWSALQNLPQQVLGDFMNKVIVHFGYDKKDVAPSTYDLRLSIPEMRVAFLENENSLPLANARSFNFRWQMRKESDLIVKQNVTCGIDLKRATGTAETETLMTISKDNSDFDGERDGESYVQPDFIYTSTSFPNGDNVKSIEIFDPCIYMVVPAWVRFSAFFQSLSAPVFLSKREIGASIQVGDRWYRIGDTGSDSVTSDFPLGIGNDGRKLFNWIPSKFITRPRMSLEQPSVTKPPPIRQLKVLLTWPRIILSSTSNEDHPTRVILRMNHVDFLQTTNGLELTKTRSLLLHDVEVYTSSQKFSTHSTSKSEERNSLIRPWTLSAFANTCNGETIADCDRHTYRLACDVLRARAAYSDMSIAIDVFLSVLRSSRNKTSSPSNDLPQHPILSSSSFDSIESTNVTERSIRNSEGSESMGCTKPSNTTCDIECDGFELKIADDSGRHFSGYQDLVILSMGQTLFSRHESSDGSTSMKMWLDCLDLFDCLQPTDSPFRTAASSHSEVMGIRAPFESCDALRKPFVQEKEYAKRNMQWKDFSFLHDRERNFYLSPSFLKRMEEASKHCSHYLWGEGGEGATPGLIELAYKLTEGGHQEYDVQFRKFALQWNPSTVIALQRFMGRLRKESKMIALQLFSSDLNVDIDETQVQSQDTNAVQNSVTKPTLITARIQIDSLTLCLNKEHQHRRLLALTLSSCVVVMHSSEEGMTVDGELGDFSAFDDDRYESDFFVGESIASMNRNVLSMIDNRFVREKSKFLLIHYKTFTTKATSASKTDVPEWIKSALPSPDDIDDFLCLTIAATRFTYLKERTDELLDYLTNGLPGKGMGATSRAAKGFISRRIQTRSFLQVNVDSPQIFIPQHEMTEKGLGLKLGDVNIQSWFEKASSDAKASMESEWWRILSLKLSGFSYGLIREKSLFDTLSSATNPIDLDILLKKPTMKGRALSIRGSMSSFESVLNYNDYVLLRAVAKDNFGRRIDTDKWDNIEKAYWMEEENHDKVQSNNVDTSLSKKVAYSTNARFVRYGKSGKKGIQQGHAKQKDPGTRDESKDLLRSTLDLKFNLAGVAMKLRRDDLPEGIVDEDDLAKAFHYDVVLLRVGSVDVVTTANGAGDISFNLSLYRVGLFDLGDGGRRLRQSYYYSLPRDDSIRTKRKRKPPSPACPFVVLAEGYLSANDYDAAFVGQSDLDGPEFVISVDQCPASSTNEFRPAVETGLPPATKVTMAKVVINYLSLNAISTPFREIADFLSCDWPTALDKSGKHPIWTDGSIRRIEKKKTIEETTAKHSYRGLQLQLVAHYPRVFFLADESDLHSRALVLKGLAVINANRVNKKEVYKGKRTDSIDQQQITSVGAQLHGLETYINPDVSTALRLSERHSEMVGEPYSTDFTIIEDASAIEAEDTLGVALIQPVTIGIEYLERERALFPTQRSLHVNVDPVSTMLSFEDLQLVEVVTKRWTSGKSKTLDEKQQQHYNVDVEQDKEAFGEKSAPGHSVDVHFSKERKVHFEVSFETQRLGLGLKTEKSNVVVNSNQNPVYAHLIEHGDMIVSIGGQDVRNKTLEYVVTILSECERPITVGFERTLPLCEESKKSSEVKETSQNSGCSICCYNLQFRSGTELGLVFERSVCGQFPVVSKISSFFCDAVVIPRSVDESDSEQIEVVESLFKYEHERIPRIGAVVVAVNGVPVEELGAEEVWQTLSNIHDRDFSGELSQRSPNDDTFSLTFQETDSATWGSIDSIEVSSAGMALSFIDDLNGRDMPLFRGKLSTLQVHIERGLGIDAHILDNAIPSLLSPLYSESDTETPDFHLSPDQVRDIQTETIISLSAISICSVDYFRPRVSFWEPLLEPSQMFFHFERQGGSIEANRPAQIALEVSDRLLHDQFTRTTFTQNNHFGESHMVSVNVTDAAAEVLVEASTRWKDWRTSRQLEPSRGDFDYVEDLMVERGSEAPNQLTSETLILGDDERLGGNVTKGDELRTAERAAAKKAAQGALIFAQKRGADTSKKSESAKPFIFRNRTGISIAFVQQGQGLRNRGYSWVLRGQSESSTIGEYDGLEDYDEQYVTELADQEDAKFNMDLIDESPPKKRELSQNMKHVTNKVRSYEGQYPDLTVAIQAVAGVLVEPITNLQVFKVGSIIRHLTVKKDTGTYSSADATRNSIQVIWSVEIEDNRRVLTLSTAVCIVSSGLNMPIEIGYRRVESDHNGDLTSETSTVSVGIARSASPFFMPLWLALKLEPVRIYVRPSPMHSTEYGWSQSSVLRFGLFSDEKSSQMSPTARSSFLEKWTWEETFTDIRCIRCHSKTTDKDPTWFSVFRSSSSNQTELLSSTHNEFKSKDEHGKQMNEFEDYEVLSVTLDSGLTVRNMLPTMIDFEVIQGIEPDFQTALDEDNGPSRFSFNEVEPDVTKLDTLKVGECTEVFEVNYTATVPRFRMKQQGRKAWSNWARLNLSEIFELDEEKESINTTRREVRESVGPSQVNVQIPDGDFGIPLTFGVRVEPKMTTEDPHRGHVYGFEVILYAEFWIRNITSLPLNFGCPAYQIHEPEKSLDETKSISDDSLAKFTAESALMELTSLLEVGDKGTALNQKVINDDSDSGGAIESLPGQECHELTEEVFEYVEIESSMVKRKWWASESYNGYHKEIFDVEDTGASWQWLDEKWFIDSSGGAMPSVGGWESCKNPSTGNGSFGGKREFNPTEGFRRRRYFRKRSTHRESSQKSSQIGMESRNNAGSNSNSSGYSGGIQTFHHPLKDSFSREQIKLRQKQNNEEYKDMSKNVQSDEKIKIAIKCGDGTWSSTTEISDSGTCFGVIRVLASRWPSLTQRHPNVAQGRNPKNFTIKRNSYSEENPTQNCEFKSGCLASDLYEFCYTVSDLDGEWGDFSRCMEVSPRFFIRNDSTTIHMKVKQTGAPNSTAVTLEPGAAAPFYWADFRLPKLVSVITVGDFEANHENVRWSGGFDMCNLGMIPVRIRRESVNADSESHPQIVTSIRVLVEVRPGTGAHGINVSLREEDSNGDGSLFRIENMSPFPIWLSQDGVLANPTASLRSAVSNTFIADGDYIAPSSKAAFALDVPYRQGKYSHRKEASLSELMHVRVALAPLSTRSGIESVKVIGLATMGETIRLNPTKLPSKWTLKDRDILENIRVLGVITTDGPTRVLKFCLMAHSNYDLVFRNAIPDIAYVTSGQNVHGETHIRTSRKDYTTEILSGLKETINLAARGEIPLEFEAKKSAILIDLQSKGDENHGDNSASDKIFSFRVEFSGFIFSLVDSAPSEIAVASLRNVNALARWNNERSADATLLLSIGWLQIDNHIPSAPFKVAVRPDTSRQQDDGESTPSPLLVIAVAFAPEHKSKISVLRSVTVAPRDLVIALDLAFLVRLQRFFMGLQDHLRNRQNDGHSGQSFNFLEVTGSEGEGKKSVPFPYFASPEKQLEQIAAFTENKKIYFQGLTILPTNIKLSVAPARALTSEQASLEGKETAAIHMAVRRGDVLVGNKSSGPLGVRVGRKNRTPLAVVRGVFKSIVVDALLRLNGASLNFHGVFLRNHIATSTQLSTYLTAHYLSSLKHNVPALLGSLSAIGNPLGLIRGIGDGVSDFVTEPMKGFKRALKELDPGYAVDGVARGTESLARHTVGGIADSASLLMETFSKYMAVVTLDRRYAQKRDRRKSLRMKSDTRVTLAGGVESGFLKLVTGFREGVTGVVKAPIRGAEKRGFEGFAKGLGKGLLGLLVKPIIGITDAATDVMIGVKSTVEYKDAHKQNLALLRNQFRPRRPMYGRDKVLRPYSMEDAAAATLMLKTRCAGENYLSHLDMNDRVALLSVKRLIILGPNGEEQLALRYKHVARLEVRAIQKEDGISQGWGIIVILNTPRRNGSDVEVITCRSEQEAMELCMLIQQGVDIVALDSAQGLY